MFRHRSSDVSGALRLHRNGSAKLVIRAEIRIDAAHFGSTLTVEPGTTLPSAPGAKSDKGGFRPNLWDIHSLR
jgi:hypothetical protein